MPDPLVTPPWHGTYIAEEAQGVPDMINNTNDLVEGLLEQNVAWTKEAVEDYHTAAAALANASGPPELPEPPPKPSIVTNFGGQIGLTPEAPPNLGSIDTQLVPVFEPEDIVVPNVAESIDPYIPIVTSLGIPAAPTFQQVAVPGAPSINTELTLPTPPVDPNEPAPTMIEQTLPSMPVITLPTFTDEAPEFTDSAPTGNVTWTEPVYASGVKDAVKAALEQMLAGGTGLPAAVELAIWERGADRETRNARQRIDAAKAEFTANGYDLPPGQLAARVDQIRDEAYLKNNEGSREVMVKQAELEQSNRQFAVKAGIDYEQVYVGLFINIADRSFQLAKFAVESSIQVFNAKVALFNVRQAVFAQKTERVKVLLEMALTQLKIVHEQLEIEKQKGEVNAQRIQLYIAKRQAVLQQIEIYKARIQGVMAVAELDKNRVEIFRAQVEGAVAQVNQQRAVFEAYSARVAAEGEKAKLEESNARAYTARVGALAAKAEITLKGAEVKIQNNRLKMEWSVANLQRINHYVSGQLATIQANLAAYQAATQKAVAKFEVDKSIKALEVQTQLSAQQLGVAYYQASIGMWQTRAQQVMSYWTVNAESIRALAQVSATFAAGAMAGTHVSAGISAGASATQGKSDQTSRSSTFQQSVSDSSNYTVQHTYNHEV